MSFAVWSTSLSRLGLLGLLGLLAACESSPDRSGAARRDASTGGGGQDAGTGDGGAGTSCTQAPGPAAGDVDILFIVDNSGSMADEQEALVRAFCGLISAIPQGTNYQIAVVTTDLDSADGEKSGLLQSTFNPAAPYNLTSLSPDACMTVPIAHGCFRGPDPTTRVITSAMSAEEQALAFAANVRVGSCGSGQEKGLAALNLAVGMSTAGGCNEGFLRPAANLIAIFVTDEEDSDPSVVQERVNELLGLKPAGQVRVAGLIGAAAGGASRCKPPEDTACGQSICMNPPPEGSHTPCTMGGAPCPTGESCLRSSGQMMWCENSALEFFTPENCGWCTFFNAPDCCSALAGGRYVDFMRSVEAAVHQAVPEIPLTSCQPQTGQRAACAVESICETDFAPALARIAGALIAR